MLGGCAVGIAAIPVPALAHAPGHALASAAATAHHHSPEIATAAPWLALAVSLLAALGAVAVGWTLRRDRRLGLGALVLLLGVAAFETGYHGVHHLGDPRGAERCAALAATAHLDAVADEAPAALAPDTAGDLLPLLTPAAPPALALALAHEGRAPPASASL
jgi:hypothetical protein